MHKKPTNYSTRANHSSGFTLIELLLYLAIMSAVATGLVMFSLSITNTRNKNYVVQEVQANSRVALDLITQKIHSATGVNVANSLFGVDPGILELAMADPDKNPTIISLTSNDGILQIKEGVNGPVAIVSDEVNVTNLVFTNLTGTNTRENIRIEVTVEYNNPSGDITFEYSQDLQTAVSLRQ